MPQAEKGVQGKGAAALFPVQHAVTPERDERSGSKPVIGYTTEQPNERKIESVLLMNVGTEVYE